MKAVLGNVLIFICLAISLSSCSGTATSADAPANETAKQNSNEAIPKPKSDYPPLAEKVAQAEITNLDKTTSKIADRKGKVVLLNLWATWCGPCRSEMPALVRLQERLGEKGFEVIGLNTDDEEVETINEFAAEMKLNYTIVWSTGQMQNELLKISKFGGIPQSFLIDRDGNLRGVFRGASPAEIRQMEKLVEKVVNEPS